MDQSAARRSCAVCERCLSENDGSKPRSGGFQTADAKKGRFVSRPSLNRSLRPPLLVRNDFNIFQFDRLAVEIVFRREI
jgi:hypothetical protein